MRTARNIIITGAIVASTMLCAACSTISYDVVKQRAYDALISQGLPQAEKMIDSYVESGELSESDAEKLKEFLRKAVK